MQTREIGDYQVAWDGLTVWVNGPDGVNRARYSGRISAIDVHFDWKTQMRTGRQCDTCCIGDWSKFVQLVRDRLGIVLPDAAKPR